MPTLNRPLTVAANTKRRLKSSSNPYGLTNTELAVFRMLAYEALTDKMIARRLGIVAAQYYITAIFFKLGIINVDQGEHNHRVLATSMYFRRGGPGWTVGAEMSERVILPTRRFNTTVTVPFKDMTLEITYGRAEDGRIVECFCSTPKTGSDLQAVVNDACIALSLLLQHGMIIDDIAKRFGEDRSEGALTGPASSIIGVIARAGAVL